MTASVFCFRAAVLVAIVGIAWGIGMAMTHDHATMPAHAHLNLLGWVSLYLFGVFYRLHPDLDRSRVAMAQAVIWLAGTCTMAAGVALIYTGRTAGDPIAAVSSLVLLADMMLFGWLTLRVRTPDTAPAEALGPAE